MSASRPQMQAARGQGCPRSEKGRTNAFWGDNFHASLIEGCDYLWRCLRSIELNMVRCGVVSHPREWPWVGYHEIMGCRERYRLVDLEGLCWRLRTSSIEELRANPEFSLQETIARDEMKRESCWTESLAIGSASFLEQIQPLILSRRETELAHEAPDLWVLKETEIPCGRNPGLEIDSKA